MLLALLDHFNHEFYYTTDWQPTIHSSTADINNFAADVISPGQPISVGYGSMDTAQFLLLYGFLPPNNPFDQFVLFENATVLLDYYETKYLADEGEEGESNALVAIKQPPSFQRGVLEETRDAAQVLPVLSRQRSEEISSALTRRQLSEDKWWTAVSRVVQGLALMAKQVQAELEADGSLQDSASSAGAAAGGRWVQLAATGEEMAGGTVPGGGRWVRHVATGEEMAGGKVM
ncbi:unnamed protein product [Closterium sp. Naga37s-1]|nr:unnamed protein product [Closterium sp. Naga37s-1]CAI5511541.1 unnamed protein product [Closterium sp. Naga37s-1]CAI5511547.1 unnamed protein product [Closterium sp. Naga37s-1]CAI5533511.1 unnamed protein product [Closterium sp. Naga37s-1]CAI5533512.1 unnamed protein product [Closterium sp. Naga37s-1]